MLESLLELTLPPPRLNSMLGIIFILFNATIANYFSQTSLVYKCYGCHSFEFQKMGKVTQTEGKQPKFGPITGPTVPQQCPHCNNGYHVSFDL
jgi:hypothetical protein